MAISPNPAKIEDFKNIWESLSHGSPFGKAGPFAEKAASAYADVPKIKLMAIGQRFQDPLTEVGCDVIDGRYSSKLAKALTDRKDDVTEALLKDDLVDTHGVVAEFVVPGIDLHENQRFPNLLYQICVSSDVGMPDWMGKALALEISYANGLRLSKGYQLYLTFRKQLCELAGLGADGDLVAAEKIFYSQWKGPEDMNPPGPPQHPWEPGYKIAEVSAISDDDIAWLEAHSNPFAVAIAKARKADLDKSADQKAKEQAEIDAAPGKVSDAYLSGKYNRYNSDGSVTHVDGPAIEPMVPAVSGQNLDHPFPPWVRTVAIVFGIVAGGTLLIMAVRE